MTHESIKIQGSQLYAMHMISGDEKTVSLQQCIAQRKRFGGKRETDPHTKRTMMCRLCRWVFTSSSRKISR